MGILCKVTRFIQSWKLEIITRSCSVSFPASGRGAPSSPHSCHGWLPTPVGGVFSRFGTQNACAIFGSIDVVNDKWHARRTKISLGRCGGQSAVAEDDGIIAAPTSPYQAPLANHVLWSKAPLHEQRGGFSMPPTSQHTNGQQHLRGCYKAYSRNTAPRPASTSDTVCRWLMSPVASFKCSSLRVQTSCRVDGKNIQGPSSACPNKGRHSEYFANQISCAGGT